MANKKQIEITETNTIPMSEFIGCEVTKNNYGTYFNQNYTLNGSPKGFELEPFFKDPQGNISDIISLARYYYNKNGLIMRVINIMRDFGVGDIINYYPTSNKKAKKIIEGFNKRIDIKNISKDMIFELSLTGNLACYNRDFKMIDIYPLTNIEVLPIKQDGKALIAFIPNYLNFSTDEYGIDLNAILSSAYPEEVVNGMSKNTMKILLNKNYSYFKKINSSSYERYGTPFILPAFDDIAHKSLLKEAERSTALGIIDKILLIKVGDKDFKPTSKMVTEYSSKFNSMKGSIRATVPCYVNMEFVEPDVSIFGVDKYEEVDSDLLSTLGISLSLVKGESGGNYSEGMINFTGLTRSIENIRSCIPSIFEDMYVKELERNGISSEHCPTFTFSEVVIDKSSKIELVQWLFQNAGLPYEIVYGETGFDFNAIKELRKTENEEDSSDIFKLREQPFQGKQTIDEGGAPEKKISDRKSDPKQSNNEQPRPSKS